MQECQVEAADDVIHQSRELRPVVWGSAALGQFIGPSVVFKRLIVTADIITVLPERVPQPDFLSPRRTLGKQRCDALQPSRIGARHFTMGRNTAKCSGNIRIEGDGALEQFFRFGESTSVGAQFTEERQRIGIGWIDRQGREASSFCIGRATLPAQRRCEAHIGRSIVGPQRERAVETRHRGIDLPDLEQHVSEVA
jgi:hypothetical protein